MAVTKHNKQGNLWKEGFIWLRVPEGLESTTVGRPWPWWPELKAD